MQDWLIKLFGGMSTKKSAGIAFFTVLLTVSSWRVLAFHLTEQGLKEELLPYFILAFWFAFSFLLVEFLIWLYGCAQSRIKKSKSDEVIKQQVLERSARVRSVLKVLPSKQMDVLKALLKEDLILNSLSSNVYTLFDEGFISPIHRTGAGESIYRIDGVVRDELRLYLERCWSEAFESFADRISIAHHGALELFFCSSIPYGTTESSSMMPNDVYTALSDLVRLGYLHSTRQVKRRGSIDDEGFEEFTIDEKFKEAIVNRALFSDISRTSIRLNWAFVLGSASSGGGA
ncbi:hypothetical protein [Pseudomonas chlororaphis]|uniref:hypothetical protein n=1 Tax=Pseudomonas chlororaphis TaxID=587753 RepID=UPI000AFC4E99|nr:hypothetical protein [Pseudomonas chlororaphis]